MNVIVVVVVDEGQKNKQGTLTVRLDVLAEGYELEKKVRPVTKDEGEHPPSLRSYLKISIGDYDLFHHRSMRRRVYVEAFV